MARYRFVGGHSEILESGRPVEPGEFVELDGLAGHDQTLFDDGALIEAEEETTKKTTKKEAEA